MSANSSIHSICLQKDLHHSKTRPLDSNLRHAKGACKTSKCTDFSATCEVRATSGQGEDVGKREGAGGCSKEDKVGRNACGRPTRDDAVVLWKIRYEDTKEDEA